MTEPRFRFNVPADLLPVAEVCSEAPWLAHKRPPVELWREGLRWGLARDTSADALGAYETHRRTMNEVYALHVEHAVNDALEDMRLGIIPHVAVLCPKLTSLPYGPIEGTLIKDDEYLEGVRHKRPTGGDFDMDISGTVDHTWVTSTEGAEPIAVVLQHELARNGHRPIDSLDLATCGLMWAAARNCDRMQLGRCYHTPTKPPSYEWSAIIEDEAMSNYWARARRALMRPHEAAPGDHCERCRVRSLCAQWQYPILIDGTTPLKTLISNVNPETYPKLKGLVGAMKHVVGLAEAKLRTYEREGRG